MIKVNFAPRGQDGPYQMHGAWAKWERAVEHHFEIRKTAPEWLDTAWRIEVEFDAELDAHVLIFRVNTEGRLRLGTIAGDCFHNLRSALDLTMWELAHQHWQESEEPVRHERELQRIVFPIARPDETLEEFKKKWVLRHVSADAGRVICDMQRFDADDPANAALRQLRILSNIDKHQLLLAAGAAVGLDETRFTVEPELKAVSEYLLKKGESFDDGTRFAVVRFEDGPHPEAIITVGHRPTSELRLKLNDTSWINTWSLISYVLVVRDGLEKLEGLFPTPATE